MFNNRLHAVCCDSLSISRAELWVAIQRIKVAVKRAKYALGVMSADSYFIEKLIELIWR